MTEKGALCRQAAPGPYPDGPLVAIQTKNANVAWKIGTKVAYFISLTGPSVMHFIVHISRSFSLPRIR